jgi:hypothetical protein
LKSISSLSDPRKTIDTHLRRKNLLPAAAAEKSIAHRSKSIAHPANKAASLKVIILIQKSSTDTHINMLAGGAETQT